MARKPRVKADETVEQKVERLKRELAEAEVEATAKREKDAKLGPLAVANVVLFKASAAFLIEQGLAPDWLVQAPQQGYPREANIAKRYGLSETERSNAIAKARKAVEGL